MGRDVGWLQLHPEFGWLCAVRHLPNGAGLALVGRRRCGSSAALAAAAELAREEPELAWVAAPVPGQEPLPWSRCGASSILQVELPSGDPRRYRRLRLLVWRRGESAPRDVAGRLLCLGPTAWILDTTPVSQGTAGAAPRYRRALGWGWRVWPQVEAALVGCGGLGERLAPELAALGLRRVWLVDGETVAPENVGCGYGSGDVGRPKAAALAARLGPAARAVAIPEAIPVGQRWQRALDRSDLWVDAAANPTLTVYLAARAAMEARWYLRVGSLARRREAGADVVLAVPELGWPEGDDSRCGCFFSVAEARDERAAVRQVRRPAAAWPALAAGAAGRVGRLHGVNHVAVGLALSLLEQLARGRLPSSVWLRVRWGREGEVEVERRGPLPGVCPLCKWALAKPAPIPRLR